MARYVSLRDFTIPSLEPGDYEKDERLDRSVLVVALGVVSGGLAFLLGMVFLLFPEWIRPIAFGPGFSEPRVYAVLLRPHAAADNGGSQETPSANQPVSVNPPPRGQTSAQATPASTGQTFGRGGDNTASQPVVPVSNTGTPGPQGQSAAAGNGNGKKLGLI
jgi:hypothetical protein